MDAVRGITVSLTRDEALALLYAYEINEFPTSNPLGREGEDQLAAAEAKLRAVLEHVGYDETQPQPGRRLST